MQDFQTQYLSYSNKELLKITTRPALYQPAAVQAAEEILATRVVNEEDHLLAASEIEQEEQQQNTHEVIISKASNRFSAAMHYLFMPTSDVFEVQRWVYLMCIGLGLQYIWETVGSIENLRFFFDCEGCDFTISEAFLIFSLVFTPFLIVLLLLKKRIGWLLAVFNSGYVLLLQLLFSGLNYRYLQAQLLFLLVTVLFHGALLRLLHKEEVRDFFHSTKKDFRNSLMFAVALGLATVFATVYLS